VESREETTIERLQAAVAQAERQLRVVNDARERSLDRAARMQSLLEELAGAVDTSDVVRATVEKGIEVTRAAAAGIWLRRSGSIVELAHAVGYPGERRERFARIDVARDVPSPLSEVFRTGKPICLGSRDELVARFPELAEYAAAREEFAVAGLPLIVAGETIGVLALSFAGRRQFEVDEVTAMLIVAGHTAQALLRARLFDRQGQSVRELERAKADTELLYRLTDAVNRAPVLDGVYGPALEALSARLEVDRCAILLFDRAGVMRFKAWKGLSEAFRRAADGRSPWGPDTIDAAPIAAADVTADPASPLLPGLEEALAAERIRALAFVPLLQGDRVIGALMLSSGVARVFSLEELKMAQTIADQVAAAVTQKQTQADRERLIEELLETVRMNQRVAGILGHDLRNPLQAMMVSAEFMLRKLADPKLVASATRIIGAGQRMNRMIEQLLDLTRVRVAGTLPIECEETDVAAVWTRAVEELQPAEIERVELRRLGETVGWWDADRLAQVASNLLGNALRHGAADAPVQVEIDGGAAAAVIVRVHNAGVIPPELAPRIFEPFQSGDRVSRRGKGLGLGLYITREIVAAHRGTVEVRSSSAAGTTFVVNLPRARASAAGKD
jgi:signal transduction histidine kinase